MQKNLSIVNQNNQLILKKSKLLMAITNNILSNDDWIQRLWDWADENGVPDYQEYFYDEGCESFIGGIPRKKDDLLIMKNFSFIHPESIIYTAMTSYKLVYLAELEQWHYDKKITLPKEASELVYLSELESWYYNKSLELPKEISNLVYLTKLKFSGCHMTGIPKEIGDLKNLIIMDFSWNWLTVLPKEIGNLINLQRLYLSSNDLVELPKEIVNLTNLTKFDFQDNPNLILTEEQKEWISELINNGCDVVMDDRYQYLYGDIETETERRDKYLAEFNIGREVPITHTLLYMKESYGIREKLDDGIYTFEEYIDEASEYIDKEKFNNLVQNLYDRDENLGRCFEQNITFNNYADNKLTWTSIATGEDKKILITHWGVINMFVKEIFGLDTKIVNIAVSIE